MKNSKKKLGCYLAALAVATVGCVAADAATATWNGAGGGGNQNIWSAKQNWNSTDITDGGGPYDILFYSTTANLTSNIVDTAITINSLTFGNSQTGAVTINASGSNTLTINSGGLTVNSGFGVVTIAAPLALGANQSWANNSSSLLTISGSVNTNAKVLTISGTGGNTTISGVISGTGSLSLTGSRTVTLSNVNTYTGLTTVTAGKLLYGVDNVISTGALTVNGSTAVVDMNNHVDSVGTVTLDGGGSITGGTLTSTASFEMKNGSASAVLAGSVALNKTTTGVVTLSGNNTYTGGTNINSGTLALASSGALGTTGTIAFGGGTLQFSASNTTDYSNRFSNAASQAYSLDTNGQNVTIASNLSSSGGSLTKLGSGILTVSGNNSYTGGTNINGGTLKLNSANAIGSSGTVAFGGGTLQYSSSNTTDYTTRFSNAASQAYKIDTNGQAVSFGTALTSSGGTFAKSGTGTLTLNAANTYSGATSVTGGTLIANITNALPTGTALTVTGATFKLGSPTITQQVSSLSLSGGSTFVVQLDGTTSAIGNITASSYSGSNQTLEVDLVNGPSNFTVGQSFTIFAGATKPGAGTFSTFILPAGYVWDTSHLQGSGGGIDGSIRVSAVPEPGPLLLGLASLAPVAALMLRKKKKLVPVAV